MIVAGMAEFAKPGLVFGGRINVGLGMAPGRGIRPCKGACLKTPSICVMPAR
jgi:hypothetical protein